MKIWYFDNNLKLFLHMCDTYNFVIICSIVYFVSTFDFQLNTDFPSQILRFLPLNYLELLKDRFFKKMLLKRAKNHRFFFFLQNYRLK